MRKREEIERDTKPYDRLFLEVLLDVRDLLIPKKGKIIPTLGTKKIGRPKGSKNKRKSGGA